eukprot:CAMPEP_0172518412 /NCGR_PEP_ID=MMETSP1066-20121228/290805_1 /TAXON_ID=671091 /ORGANISM="Coscinodiscus wailesii, Strain CCMP2513" /LENGTH=286 /DNA_ID=CAMNT_0013300801 /DNA_START=53 /DNA_END=912 /DNA_ORIENTATION=-
MRISLVMPLVLSLATARKRKPSLRKKTVKRDLNINVFPVTGQLGQDMGCDNVLTKRSNLRRTQEGAYNITRIGDVTISERFKGLVQETPKGILGLEDRLSGQPTDPLTIERNFNEMLLFQKGSKALYKKHQKASLGLEDNLSGEPTDPLTIERNFNHRENIYITKPCQSNPLFEENTGTPRRLCNLRVMGRGPAGFKGLGAMAYQFETGQRRIQLRFWSDGTAEAAVMFYRADARHLGTLYVDLRITNEYVFERAVDDIVGIAIWPRGEKMEWHKFALTGLCHQKE